MSLWGYSDTKKKSAPFVPERNYGWCPDTPDHRDFKYEVSWRDSQHLPSKCDLTHHMSPVEDQGELGSCTANALAGNLEYNDIVKGLLNFDISRLFIYYNERKEEGTIKSDCGAMIRTGIKTLVKYGACLESRWPYDIKRFANKPSADCYKTALQRRIKKYQRIMSLDGVLVCLASGFPVVFGFSVPESFGSDKVAKTGTLMMPKKNERIVGGHAVLAVGYNMKSTRLLVRNSWGPEWGKDGYFTMPFGYVESTELSDDFWTIRA